MTKNNKQVVIKTTTKQSKGGKTTKEETFWENRNRLYKERGGMFGTGGPLQYAGHVAGAILGGPAGFAAGGALGQGLGYFTGTGDYTLHNYKTIKSNACTVPGFSKNDDSVVVTHREYIQDVKSASTGTPSIFELTTLALNPGQPNTFPWLAGIACQYEEFEIQGAVFEFVSTSGQSVASTNTAIGTIIMATEYDPTKPAFANKQAMENYSFATSNRSSESFMHAIECKKSRTPVSRLYVRTGANTGTDLRWTDFGNFHIATTGMPANSTVLGELWITYKVKLFKPRLPITIGATGQIYGAHYSRSGAVSASPLGTTTVTSSGPMALTLTGTKVTWFGEPGATYKVSINITAGTSSSALSLSASTNLDNVLLYSLDTAAGVSTGGALVSIYNATFKCNNTNNGILCAVEMNANTIVGTANTDIIVTQLDNTVTV